MPLAANALIDCNEYLRYRGLDTEDESIKRDRIEAMINAASTWVQDTYLERQFIKVTTAIAELFDGDDTSIYVAKNGPILISTAPTLHYWNGTSWQLPTGTTWTYDVTSREFYFTDGSVFGKGFKNWKLTYLYGVVLASVPADLKEAICQIVHRRDLVAGEVSGKEGLASESFGDSTTSYDLGQFAPEIRRILNGYRNIR